MAEPVRHRQTKGAATDMFDLQSPRHISTLRILSSPGGPGHVLYLKSELTEARWRIYSDNIAMARWLQSTVLGVIDAELLDLTIAVTEAQFSKSGDARDFWTERLDTRNEQIVL